MKITLKKYIFLLIIFSCLFPKCISNEKDEIIEDAKISLSTDSLIVDYSNSKNEITVNANSEWEVASNQYWCTINTKGGAKGDKTLILNVLENTIDYPRTATITFKIGTNYTKNFKITQTATKSLKLVWQDEFNTEKSTMPSSSNWWYETGNNGWGNNELQNYVAGTIGNDTLAYISNGTLKIFAKKINNTVNSIRMNTSKSWTYGYFEARLKLPKGKGSWPAFWMLPKNFVSWPSDGEIDIMEEVGYNPNYVSSSIHCLTYYHSIGTQKTAQQFVETAESDFHVYAVEWNSLYIKGFIDGQNYFTFHNDGLENKSTWPFNVPFYLKLNLAWGGNWGGAQGVDESKLPLVYEIDYVRVYQK